MERRTTEVLIVDDDQGARFGLQEFLGSQGFRVLSAASVEEAREVFRRERPDVVVTDYVLPDGNGIELMNHLRDCDASLPVVMITGHGSVQMAVGAMKAGAETVLTKPVDLAGLGGIVARLAEILRSRRRRMAGDRTRATPPDPFAGSSAVIAELRDRSRRAASSSNLPILIEGETGTGKGVLARWIHEHSPRAAEAFVDLNCAGLRSEFLETEIFGHEKGAFTGATQRKLGLLEVAHRGTLFLDEIGDISADVQPKVLKVLEEQSFRRLGEVRDRRVDARLIAATHQRLESLVAAGRFRQDLFYRIGVIRLRVPALRERSEDLPMLAREMLRRLAAELGRHEPPELSPCALAALREHIWPGNFRELKNTLERALLFSDRAIIRREDLELDLPLSLSAGSKLEMTLIEAERRHIERVLKAVGGKVGLAAERLAVPRSTLYEKLKRYGIRKPGNSPDEPAARQP